MIRANCENVMNKSLEVSRVTHAETGLGLKGSVGRPLADISPVFWVLELG